MANLTIYTVKKLSKPDFKICAGLYNDFKARAVSDYKFDLEPLNYEDFTEAIENKLLECLVLSENSIPVGFLIYTTLISYSVELNMIYLNSDDNYEEKARQLILDFLKREKELLSKKIVTYPLLGEQEKYQNVIKDFWFQFINQSVLKFDFSNPSCITKINEAKDLEISNEFKISDWRDNYFDKVVKVIHNNFRYENDALFDPRFKTFKGVKDILNKITKSEYGNFLPKYTKVVFKNDRPIGVCFVNVTGEKLVNIPLVAVDREYRGKGLGKKMVSLATQEILEDKLNSSTPYTEINVTTDTLNESAVKMYEFCGFKEDYQYIQSYRKSFE